MFSILIVILRVISLGPSTHPPDQKSCKNLSGASNIQSGLSDDHCYEGLRLRLRLRLHSKLSTI